MKKVPIIITKEAENIYAKFKSIPGSRFVALPVSIQWIINYCHKYLPKKVLEIGSGTGTMTQTILDHSEAYITCYEEISDVVERLVTNVTSPRIEVRRSYKILPDKYYDLIIIDGPAENRDAVTQKFLNHIEHIGMVYIDGTRRSQRAMAIKILTKRYACKVEMYEADNFHIGGTEILCTSAGYLKRKLSFLYFKLTDEFLFQRFKELGKRFLRIS